LTALFVDTTANNQPTFLQHLDVAVAALVLGSLLGVLFPDLNEAACQLRLRFWIAHRSNQTATLSLLVAAVVNLLLLALNHQTERTG
jgi:hypothetical protein